MIPLCLSRDSINLSDGKELMLIILGTILTMTTPTGSLSPRGSLIYLGVFRILLGIGVGGDYPMSATVTSDRANLRKRGTMLAYIFANQGWGSLIGALMTIIVLACYKNVMEEGQISKVDGGKSTLLRTEPLNPDCSLVSMAYCRWRFPHSCLRNPVPTSHATRINAFRKHTTGPEC